jgi:hypothetical protein
VLDLRTHRALAQLACGEQLAHVRPRLGKLAGEGGDIDHVMAYGNEFHARAFFLRFSPAL